jgi:hypothetical protein
MAEESAEESAVAAGQSIRLQVLKLELMGDALTGFYDPQEDWQVSETQLCA